MSSRYLLFDRSRLQLVEADEDMRVTFRDFANTPKRGESHYVPDGSHASQLQGLVQAVHAAKKRGAPVVMFLGAHAIKLALGPVICDMFGGKLLDHVAGTGATMLHDYELAKFGRTSEKVAERLREGKFGLRSELEALNYLAATARDDKAGYGEVVGWAMIDDDVEKTLPGRDVSVLFWAYKNEVPFTTHLTIGADVSHMSPRADGADLGAATYNDFLIFVQSVYHLVRYGGVFLNIGSAVTGPELFLKALSMARNVLGSDAKPFTTAVFDVKPMPQGWQNDEPDEGSFDYYNRGAKTVMSRAVADGGQSFYVQGLFQDTLPKFRDMLFQELDTQ